MEISLNNIGFKFWYLEFGDADNFLNFWAHLPPHDLILHKIKEYSLRQISSNPSFKNT